MPLEDARRPLGATQPPTEARFESLIRDYGRLIASVVARVGGPAVSEVREDVEQEVRLSLWRQLQAEQTIHHPSSYVYATAVRETVRWVKRELARRVAAVPEELAATEGDPWRALAAREDQQTFEACLNRLTEDRQRALRAHLAGFDVQETMRMYDWSYQKARNLIARGMADLRGELRNRGLGG